jgi:outer membrane receptor protein involved in Fe transport
MKNRTSWFIGFLTMLMPIIASASEGALSASPAVVMLRGTAGQSTTQTLTIINSTSQPFPFEMVARDVVVRNGARALVDAGRIAGSVAATAVFSTRSATVMPGQRVRVSVTLTVPKNPTSRAVVALFHGTSKLNSNGMHLVASLGTLLTFALTDQVSANTSPLLIKAPTSSTNLTLSQQLANNGGEPLFAKGMLAILNGSGALIAKSALPARRLLPGESTDVRVEYPGELHAGHYRALVTYDLQNGKTITSSSEFDVR